VEVDVLVPGQPLIALGLVGPEVVEDDVDLLAGIVSHDLVHEGEELDPAAPPGVLGRDLTGRDVERGENRVLLPHRRYSCAWPWSERPLGSLR
jgi:hypothetical protein